MNNFIVLTSVLACLIAAAYGDHHHHHHHHHHMVPHYHFKYGVHDPHTHDHKEQEEHRHHDDVHGSYHLDEPDGTKREVKYTSDKHDGFQALVKREGHAKHPHGATSYVGTTHWGHGSGR